jgi:hypothetical protein
MNIVKGFLIGAGGMAAFIVAVVIALGPFFYLMNKAIHNGGILEQGIAFAVGIIWISGCSGAIGWWLDSKGWLPNLSHMPSPAPPPPFPHETTRE